MNVRGVSISWTARHCVSRLVIAALWENEIILVRWYTNSATSSSLTKNASSTSFSKTLCPVFWWWIMGLMRSFLLRNPCCDSCEVSIACTTSFAWNSAWLFGRSSRTQLDPSGVWIIPLRTYLVIASLYSGSLRFSSRLKMHQTTRIAPSLACFRRNTYCRAKI